MKCFTIMNIALLCSSWAFDYCHAEEDEKIHIKIIVPEIIKHQHSTKVIMMKGNKKKPEKKPSKTKKPQGESSHETEDHNHSFIESFIKDNFKEAQHISKKPSQGFQEFVGGYSSGSKHQPKYKYGYSHDKDVKAHKLAINGPHHIDEDTTIIDAYSGHTGQKRQVKHPKGVHGHGYSSTYTPSFSGSKPQNDWYPITKSPSSTGDSRFPHYSSSAKPYSTLNVHSSGGYKVHETPDDPNPINPFPPSRFPPVPPPMLHLVPANMAPQTTPKYNVNVRYASTSGHLPATGHFKFATPTTSSLQKPSLFLVSSHGSSSGSTGPSQGFSGGGYSAGGSKGYGGASSAYNPLQTNAVGPSSVGTMYSKFTGLSGPNGPTSVQYAVHYTHPTTTSLSGGAGDIHNSISDAGSFHAHSTSSRDNTGPSSPSSPSAPVSYSSTSGGQHQQEEANDVQSTIKYMPCPTHSGQTGNCMVIMDSRNLANTHYSSVVRHPIPSASEPVAKYSEVPLTTSKPSKFRTRKDIENDSGSTTTTSTTTTKSPKKSSKYSYSRAGSFHQTTAKPSS